MRDYVRLHFIQKLDSNCVVGRTFDECVVSAGSPPYKADGKLYVILDRDRVALLAATYLGTPSGNNQLNRALLGQNLSFTALPIVHNRPNGFKPDEIVLFESPRRLLRHGITPSSWAIH